MDKPPSIFDRRALRRAIARCAKGYADADFLYQEVTDRLNDRVADVARRFDHILHMGAGRGELAAGDQAAVYLRADLAAHQISQGSGIGLVCDDECLPLADEIFDLAVYHLNLHWTNDLPGALIQANRALKPDGYFIATMFGGDTLWELRQALSLAEERLKGGTHPRIAPFAQLRDLGGLLQRAGFALPVVDSDVITVTYENPLRLLTDLKGMGQTNVLTNRFRGLTHPRLFALMSQMYLERFAFPDGRVPATFEVMYLTGWAPGPDQPKPKTRGSATARLADALGTKEQTTGIKAGS